MSGYAQLVAEHQRIAILQALDAAPAYRSNQVLLQAFLESVGLPTSSDIVRTQLSWLAEQQLVHVDESGGVTMATLSERGSDVAHGRATVPGVKRPTPRR